MRIIWIVTGFALSSFLDSLLVIKSSRTPKILVQSFKDNLILDLNYLSYDFIDRFKENPSIIVDLTFDPRAFLILDFISSSMQIPYLTLTRSFDRNFSPLRFYAFPSVLDEAKNLLKMIKYMEWTNFTIFLSSSQESLQISDFIFRVYSPHQVRICTYDSDISYNELDNLVKRYLKVTFTSELLILDQGQSLNLLLQILKTRKVSQYGKYFLLSFSSIYSINFEGSLILTPESVIDSTSQDSFYYLAIKNTLKNFKPFNIENFKER